MRWWWPASVSDRRLARSVAGGRGAAAGGRRVCDAQTRHASARLLRIHQPGRALGRSTAERGASHGHQRHATAAHFADRTAALARRRVGAAQFPADHTDGQQQRVQRRGSGPARPDDPARGSGRAAAPGRGGREQLGRGDVPATRLSQGRVCLPAWQDDDAQLQTFEAVLIEGPIDPDLLADAPPETLHQFLPEDIQRLAEHCRWNVIALVQGATPNYYLSVVSGRERAERGLVGEDPQVSHRIDQLASVAATGTAVAVDVVSMCRGRGAGHPVAATAARMRSTSCYADVAVLYDSALHGIGGRCRSAGSRSAAPCGGDSGTWPIRLDVRSRQDTRRVARNRSRASPGHESANGHRREPGGGQQLSFARGVESAASRNKVQPFARPPWPASSIRSSPMRSSALVDELMAGTPDVPKERCPAVHGAARRTALLGQDRGQRVPADRDSGARDRIGPQTLAAGHTLGRCAARHLGHSRPRRSRPIRNSARRLAAAIPGLQLDAAAHKEEHSIEVHLPLLARLGPVSRCRRAS